MPTPLHQFLLSSGSEPPLSLPHADLVEVTSVRFLAHKDSAASAVEEVVELGENAVSALLLRWRWGLAHSIYWSGIGGGVFLFCRAFFFAAH